jgi:N-acyl-D-aspartate/D-glutamate deacylase
MGIIIKNGLFFSGIPNEKAIKQDILIDDAGQILEISSCNSISDEGLEIIDAERKWIVPGFIDSHTHYDAELLASPGLKESARHGVTTIILGSCSVSAVFNSPEDTTDSFARVEVIPRDVMLPLLENEKTWNTPKEWKAYINKLPLGINIASFIGHSDIRMKAMGINRSLSDNVSATKQEEEIMLTMLNEALDEGFIGMLTMDNPWDKMDGDRYWSHKIPSFYSYWKERKS